jgi:hypothetical protein
MGVDMMTALHLERVLYENSLDHFYLIFLPKMPWSKHREMNVPEKKLNPLHSGDLGL